MIPAMNIVAWGRTVPWVEQRQVEQDLIMARALVEIFSNDFLRTRLRFRGGTALNKLHLPKALRYSEDIDLTRTTGGKLGPGLIGCAQFCSLGWGMHITIWVSSDRLSPSPWRPRIRRFQSA
jgi:Nucleotidyl transferase AbiEii toxin, Type IV TA system